MDDVHQPVQLGDVGKGARIAELLHHRDQKRLLTVGAVQIAVFQPMTLTYKRQGLGGVEGLFPCGEVGARVAVVDGVVQADGDAAELGGQVIEADQVDLCEVIDGLTGQPVYGIERGAPTGLTALLLQRRLVGDALVDELVRLIGLGEAIGFLDLDVLVAGYAFCGHPVITRDRERGDLVVRAHVHQDQGVGVVATGIRIARVQLVQDRPGQVVAVLVLPRVQTDQQHVHGAVAGLAALGLRAGGGHMTERLVEDLPARTGYYQTAAGQQRENGPRGRGFTN
ncbi:Uncharacterised protein [Mycobacteroides abscessus subsp. abscessus]|nr:Uncharacterised protein [Mycobacteroides abscessus subsp. abscessus]